MKRLTPDQLEGMKKLKKQRSEEKVKQRIKKHKKKDMEELGKPKHPGNSFTLFLLDQDRGEASQKVSYLCYCMLVFQQYLKT